MYISFMSIHDSVLVIHSISVQMIMVEIKTHDVYMFYSLEKKSQDLKMTKYLMVDYWIV
jgi:hypothetical protein